MSDLEKLRLIKLFDEELYLDVISGACPLEAAFCEAVNESIIIAPNCP